MKKEQWINVTFESMEDLEEDAEQNANEYHNIQEVVVDRKTGSS